MNELQNQLRQLSTRLHEEEDLEFEPRPDVRRKVRFRRLRGAIGLSLSIILVGMGGYVGLELISQVPLAPPDTLAQASAATKGADTAHFDLSMRFSMSTGDQEVSFDLQGEGAYDLEGDVYSMKVEVGGSGSLGTGIQGIEVIQDGSTVYMRNPKPGGKPWIAFESTGMQGVTPLDSIPGFAMGDPSQMLDHLRSLAHEIEVIGDESIRGARTTHYRAAINREQAAANRGIVIGGSLPSGEEGEQAPSIRGTQPRVLPIDVWIDSENRLRKMEISIDTSALGAAGTGIEASGIVVFELYDFGAPIEIEIPDPDQIELAESFQEAFEQ